MSILCDDLIEPVVEALCPTDAQLGLLSVVRDIGGELVHAADRHALIALIRL